MQPSVKHNSRSAMARRTTDDPTTTSEHGLWRSHIPLFSAAVGVFAVAGLLHLVVWLAAG